MKNLWVSFTRGIRIQSAMPASLLLAVLITLMPSAAQAIPLFSRQVGVPCSSCHAGGAFPELTPFGRQFKLRGYTLGSRKGLPLSGALIVSETRTRSTAGSDPAAFPHNGQAELELAALYAGGKITDHLGAFAQWNYDGIEHHSALEMADIRYAREFMLKKTSVLVGVTLNNSPTVQDVWNTLPMWSFPNLTSPVGVMPSAVPAIDMTLASQVAGLGVYSWIGGHYYLEVSAYRTADGAFSVLRAGQPTSTPGGVAALQGYNPYWRLAYERDWGVHSLELGTFGLAVDRYPDNTLAYGATNRYRDLGVDAQYQYIAGEHVFSTQVSYVHERQDYRASFPVPVGVGPTPANPTDTLNVVRLKGSYWWRQRYGATLGLFSTRGTADPGLYPAAMGDPAMDSLDHRPNTQGMIFELGYLPVQNLRLSVQYTHYLQFNGAANNYDGLGRRAVANDTLYMYAWLLY
jgi:hypothetical protein